MYGRRRASHIILRGRPRAQPLFKGPYIYTYTRYIGDVEFVDSNLVNSKITTEIMHSFYVCRYVISMKHYFHNSLLFTQLLSKNFTSSILFVSLRFSPQQVPAYTLHAREQTKKEGQPWNTAPHMVPLPPTCAPPPHPAPLPRIRCPSP